jgi:hypothetical protein
MDVTEVVDIFETIKKQGFLVSTRGAARIAGSMPYLIERRPMEYNFEDDRGLPMVAEGETEYLS